MNILITGAAGFIGSHLCETLLSQNHEVTGLDNFDPFYGRDIKQKNLTQSYRNTNFSFVQADIRSADLINGLFSKSKFDVVFHLAAKAGVRPSIANPQEYMDVNVNGTTVLLDAAAKTGVKKIVFASSSSVYGNNPKIPFAETDNVDFPISPYAASKKADELICYTYSHLYEMNISCMRLFTVYGPRQRPDLAIHKFTKSILADKPIELYGDGSAQRDYTYIDDIIDGLVSAMSRLNGYNIYNLGNSHPIRLDTLVAEIEKTAGKRAKIKKMPPQPGDVERTYADISKAQKELDFNPKTPLEQGLKKFIDWFKKQ